MKWLIFEFPLVIQDTWARLEDPYGSIFLSIPTILDSSLAPEGQHILHIFTTSSIEEWEVNSTNNWSENLNLQPFSSLTALLRY